MTDFPLCMAGVGPPPQQHPPRALVRGRGAPGVRAGRRLDCGRHRRGLGDQVCIPETTWMNLLRPGDGGEV